MDDETLEKLGEKLRVSLKKSSDVQLIVIKENHSKNMILSIPHRDIWECPLDHEVRDESKPHHYGILEGIVHFKPNIVRKGHKVYVEVMACCTYEKDELDQFDLNVKRYEYHDFREIYPKTVFNYDEIYKYPTVIKKMLRKFGPDSYVFRFDLRSGPDSVKFYDYNDAFFQNGVKWTVRTYVSKELEIDTPMDGISIDFRKLSFLWTDIKSLYHKLTDTCERGFKSCCLDGGRVELGVEINKGIYYFGESIPVLVAINNLSDRVVKGVRITCEQSLTLNSWTKRTDRRKVAEIWITGEEMKMPILAGRNWSEVRKLIPGTCLGKNFVNLALEYPPQPVTVKGWRDCCLASTTLRPYLPKNKVTVNNIQPNVSNVLYDDPCMTIGYEVVVTCDIQGSCPLATPLVSTSLDFVLVHSHPEMVSGMLKNAKQTQ